MAELTPRPPLGGYDRRHGALRLRERSDLALVSLALPLGGEDAAAMALRSAYGLDLPPPGRSAANDDRRLIRMGPDQAMLVFPDDSALAEPAVRAALKGACYTTNQTDAWAVLQIAGHGVRDVLERLCPLDLDAAAFAVHAAQRTVIEHMGAMILRDDTDSFQLFSASSSAGSFLHAVETSIANTT